MTPLEGALKDVYLGNTVLTYLIFLGTLIVGVAAVAIFRSIVLVRLRRWSAGTRTTLDDFFVEMVQRTVLPLLYYGVFYLAVRGVVLHPLVDRVVDVAGVLLFTWCAIRFLTAIVEYMLRQHWTRTVDPASRENSIRALLPAIHVTAWILGILYLLENLGFKISAIVTGLGIGGIAVALAAQAVLGDLFSYFAILFDKPFEVGDFIAVDDFLGSIEHVGVKTTRLRSLSGEQLVFSNTDLTKSRVRNYRRMETRRVEFTLRVRLETPGARLAEIPEVIRTVITAVDGVRFDRAHLASIGEYSFDFVAVYIVATADYNRFMDLQQRIYLQILSELERRQVQLAVPVRALQEARHA
ncbi:MAG TPA: mechanosensitive ion channel domain-containing protein [Bacteroidota bacterium]